MTIKSERISKSAIEMFISGRLDTATAPLLERKLKQWGDDITEIILDFSGLCYISSMGLRVLLQAQRSMNEKERKLSIRNMSDSIREVFEMTGFINLLVQDEKFVIIRKDEPDRIRLSLIGEMDAVNIPALETELVKIRDAGQPEPVLVVLDMERLALFSVTGCQLLRQAIASTAWENRKLVIENIPPEIGEVFAANGGLDTLTA